jgi:CHAT domain-containing protein
LKYPKPCTIEQARAELEANEIALVYVPGSRNSSLLVVRPRGEPQTEGIQIYPLPPEVETRRLVASLTDLETLAHPTRAREAGVEGYNLLLSPVADAIRGKDLVIVPGGDLGLLPFGLLVRPDPAHSGDLDSGLYLVETHDIRYAPSLTTLHHVGLWNEQRPTPTRDLWAIGDPVYNPKDPRLRAGPSLASLGRSTSNDLLHRERGELGRPGALFPRLEQSGREVEVIARMLGAGRDEIAIGPAATESAVKRASASGVLAGYRFIHFATHGILGRDAGI